MFRTIAMLLLAGFCGLMPLAFSESPQSSDSIEPAIWQAAKSEQKPWTRWWWMGNVVTKEGITSQLEAFAEVGLGGVEISPIYGVEGYESESLDYLSADWVQMLRYTVSEAERLGLKVDMITGSGWPFGGSKVRASDAARRLEVQQHALDAGQRLEVPLVHTERGMQRAAPLQRVFAYSDAGELLELTDRVDASGQLDWVPEAGSWTVVALFNSWTGMKVKRPAPGEDGWVVDHFSVNALQRYLGRFDDAFTDVPQGTVRSFFNDSFEVYGANWTGEFLDDFERFHGYRLEDVLPVYLGLPGGEVLATARGLELEEMHRRIQSDYHETIHLLALNEFTKPWVEWAHSKGSKARNQAHGFPANLLDIYGVADIPETEIFGQSRFAIPDLRRNEELLQRRDSPHPLILKFASSAAHVEGRGLVGSESATWLDEHFTVSLSQVRPHMDMLLISGINHIFYHGTPYSPPEAEWPGWKFYASTHFAPSNTFWKDFGELNRYLARVQSILQSGQPANDILLYFPIHDLWESADSKPGEPYYLTVHNPRVWFYNRPHGDLAERFWEQGYSFDYVSDRQLLGVQEQNGKLTTGGARYQTLVVPALTHMPVESFKQLIRLAESGATVIWSDALPASVPGLGQLAGRSEALQTLLAKVDFRSTDKADIWEARLGAGQFLKADAVEKALALAAVRRESIVEKGIQLQRRTHEGGYYYFLANLYGDALDEWVPLACDAQNIVIMDPLTGRYGKAALRAGYSGQTEVYLQMEAGESRVLKTCESKGVVMPNWSYLKPAGKPQVLSGTWQVRFVEGGPTKPEGFETEQLASWTELGDSAAKHFAGTATYSIEFERPQGIAESWRLRLGRVAESARIRLNGTELGTVWSHPFELDMDAALFKDGKNRLEMDVTNLMLNRIIDMDQRGVRWQKFHDINVVDLNYQPFNAAEWPLLDSGLLGPVEWLPLRSFDPR